MMRELSKDELLIVSGGMIQQANRQATATQFTCNALGTGAGKIGGTATAIAAVAITRNPATALPAVPPSRELRRIGHAVGT